MSDDESKVAASVTKVATRPKSPRLLAPKMCDLNDLKKQRGVLKCRLTNFEKYISKLDVNSLDSVNKTQLNVRTELLVTLFAEFNAIQTKIEQDSDDNDLISQLDYRETFETQYSSLLATAQCMVKQCEPELPTNSSSGSCCKPLAIKLPDLKLPAFSGLYDQWIEFRSSYVSMIHNRKDLDSIQKFHYLKSSLTGSALEVISALEFTASNYGHAWELLEKRYHNNRLLVQNHVKSLFNAPTLNSESPFQIRKLIDSFLRNLRALNSLNEPTDSWDTLVIYLIVSKLDPVTAREWECYKGNLLDNLNNSQSLKVENILTFLRNRADMLETIKSNNSKNYSLNSKPNYEPKTNVDFKRHLNTQRTNTYVSAGSKNTVHKNNKHSHSLSCPLCGNNHALYSCASFLNLSLQDRIRLVTSKNLCHNCIRSTNHTSTDCVFGPCKLCHQKHNSLLHFDHKVNHDDIRTQSSSLAVENNTLPQQSSALHTLKDSGCEYLYCEGGSSAKTILLSTALVEIAGSDNKYHTVRTLLDNGSQNTFITERLCNRLGVKKVQSTIRVCGVGQLVSQSSYTCKVNMRSKLCDYNTQLHCLVLANITSKLPLIDVNSDSIRIPSDVQLADPSFHISSEIDLLIGVDVFWNLLCDGKIKLKSGPYLLQTKLGWIIAGPIYCKRNFYTNSTTDVQCNFSQIDSQLRKFWELEEIKNDIPVMTKEELFCEELFLNTTKRLENGRFSVRIPFKESPEILGDSYTMAKNRFLSLERKLERAPQYRKLYTDFMREYESLGHMTLLQNNDNIENLKKPYYILPHHGVYKEDSVTTKLRVVFDASAATTSHKSLNDIQHIGLSLQNDIFSILLRFRQYQYVACADIEKMYRQIEIQVDQRNLQLILWRESRDDPIQIYRLNTVTYGCASAPYLSIRCLKQLARECDNVVIARVIDEHFFVDDLNYGNDSFDDLQEICSETAKVLQSACFPLRKWVFNHDVSSQTSKDLCIGDHCQSKTLGLGWFNTSDELHFTTKIKQDEPVITKRMMLSVISQIYDPLGLLAPAMVTAKILLQRLWQAKVGWDDDAIPSNIKSVWHNFMSNLCHISDIRIPRCVVENKAIQKELHIFTDASQDAYGACAYIRSYINHESPCVRLLCAKSKVAPIKTVSTPKLELCSALVGANLYDKIIKSLRLTFDKVYFWTDSTIVLGWLRMSPHMLKTFVQNRVVQINELTGDTIWRHIRGTENPADLLTRGVNLGTLKVDSPRHLWWHGPTFLHEQSSSWPQNSDNSVCSELPELKNNIVTLTSHNSNNLIDFNRFSSFNKLKRVCAYVLRFVYNSRCSQRVRAPSPLEKITGSLSVDELCQAERTLVKCVQMQSFTDIYNDLNKGLRCDKGSQYKRVSGLNVFLDNDKIIRVGGRLCNSDFSYDKKHPILLCSKHLFSRLLCEYEHKRLCHAGPQLLVASIREQWWVLGARNLARQVVHNCVVCTRMKGKTLTPVMGNLPSERLEPSFPFMRCGADNAGPFFILNRKGRGSKLIKCYICIFICFTTRAIHLELVGGLSTQEYILSLKRFISRRGKPCQIFSDNGRNFVGAERELSAIFENQQQIVDFASENNIRFSFIPPYAPHFGGLWEAGVKSCKYHLRRVIGNAKLTYEEFSTVLTQIEAVLNSRPMSPLSSDPHDYLPLTPAHFLIGRPLTSLGCQDVTATAPARLGRYERLEQLRQHFWERWSKEYVSELQRRTKWTENKDALPLDSLVLIKEDNLPPLRWRMGRIVRLFTGKDGVSRVAEIRTAAGTIQRACSKICPLLAPPAQTEA